MQPLQGKGSLATYSYPEVIVPPTRVMDGDHEVTVETRRSELYGVSVRQAGKAQEAYVMFTPNPHETGNLSASPHTHWTNFSFSGEVTVTVKSLTGPIKSVELYPARKAPSFTIDGNEVSFELDSSDSELPLQLYVRINEERDHPLLVFADPPESDVPDRSNKRKVELIRTTDDIETVRAKLTSKKPYAVFEEGIHQWGNDKTSEYAGYQLPYVSGKRIYIPGGAYVIGTFNGENIHNAKIYGRGVLSACGKDRLPGMPAIPYSMIHQAGEASKQVIEGIVSTDAPHFHLTFRGQVIIDNVKMIGYWHQTDGTVTGNNSVVKNTFMKTNDDYIKLYSDNSYHENNTMFHQVNGAPFQFCWGTQNGDNNMVKDTYIIYSSYGRGDNVKKNTAVINARNAPEQITENNIWDGIYIDNGCHMLIGLNAQGEEKSIFRNFIIRNVILNTGFADAPQDGASYLRDGAAGNFVNIRFENLVINGKPVTGSTSNSDKDGKGKLWCPEGGEYLIFK
ncbi:MAG: hypothetical protein AB3N63_11205 [Puniceicoccaceae bacterium]